jgi:hypothetical protein
MKKAVGSFQRPLKRVAPRTGLEPVTYRLTAGRSTIELSGKVPAILMVTPGWRQIRAGLPGAV